jgi:hypothetical protein
MKFRIILGLTLACVSATPAWAGHRVTAAIMFSPGEDTTPGANGSDAFMVEVSTKTMRRFITNDQFTTACLVLPLTFPVGTTVEITGVLQTTGAIPGSVPPFTPNAATAISVIDGFDVEGYSTGLGKLASDFDPTLPANIIAGTDYGLAWYDANGSPKPGPYSYTVAGCKNKGCPTKVEYFNQIDTGELPPTPCKVLVPMSPQ